MLKLVNEVEKSENKLQLKDNFDEQEAVQEEINTSRIHYLKMTIEEEKEKLSDLERKVHTIKENTAISGIFALSTIGIFFFIRNSAFQIVVSFLNYPLIAIVVLGFVVKFIAEVVKRLYNNVPMYIWCEQEERGIVAKHDNYVRQHNCCKQTINELESELQKLSDSI